MANGFVYFFAHESENAIKIGYTDKPDARLANAKTWLLKNHCDWEDIYPGTREDEKALHVRFKSERIEREWFKWDGPVWDFMEDLQDARIALNLERFGDPNANEIPIAELIEFMGRAN